MPNRVVTECRIPFTTPDGDIEYWETIDAPADNSGAGVDEVRLFINLGRRQGIKGSELGQFLQEVAQLSGGQVGHVQMRDNFSFVNVSADAADAVIEKATGQTYNDRELRVERAKRP